MRDRPLPGYDGHGASKALELAHMRCGQSRRRDKHERWTLLARMHIAVREREDNNGELPGRA